MADDFALAAASTEPVEPAPALAGPSTPKKKSVAKKPRKENGTPGSKAVNAKKASAMAIDGTRVGDGEVDDDETVDGGDDEEAGPANGSPSQQRKVSSRRAPAPPNPGVAVFPIAKLKRLIKSDVDVETVGQDSTFLLSVAAGVFIRRLTHDALGVLRMEGGKRKAISYGDLVRATKQSEDYEFLLDVLPEQISLEQALKQSQLNQPEEDAAENEAEAESRANEERLLDERMDTDLPDVFVQIPVPQAEVPDPQAEVVVDMTPS